MKATKIIKTLVCWSVIPLLVSCALQPVVLAPVGPGPAPRAASSLGKGDLEVYSETEEYNDKDLSYFPHTDYQIYTTDGKLLKRVWNHQNHEDESPAIVTLPPGKYIVKAWAEFYGVASVPVVILPNKTTTVILQPGWKPGTTIASSDLVQMPNGYYVGWRAQLSGQK